jgi:hypothetical protein
MIGEFRLVAPSTLGEADERRLRSLNVDLTPRPVVAQGVRRLLSSLEPRRRRVGDVFAGAGVWAHEVGVIGRELGHTIHTTAIELRAEEEPWLTRNADTVRIGDWSIVSTLEPFDLIVCNPDFDWAHVAIPALLGCLVPGGRLLVFLHNGLGQRGVEGHKLFDAYPPSEQWRVRGPIEFRGREQINPKTKKPYGADVRDYSHWVWVEGDRGPGWRAEDLPVLPAAQRRWAERPGAEWRP